MKLSLRFVWLVYHNKSLYKCISGFPPLATQQAIVAEIEAEQALVNANRELITRFEKKIQVTLARVWRDSCAAA
jgi:hypothetical protein